MGIIFIIVLVLYLPKIAAGWASNYQINKKCREIFQRADKGMRETHKKLAEKYDYDIGADGMVNRLRYSDGSKRHNPDGSEGAPKGKYF